jgi:hypothetical protein
MMDEDTAFKNTSDEPTTPTTVNQLYEIGQSITEHLQEAGISPHT